MSATIANSAETIDLIKADLQIDRMRGGSSDLGAFPEISRVYVRRDTAIEPAAAAEDRISIAAKITQVIPPGSRDRFSIRLNGMSAAEVSRISGTVADVANNQYELEFR